MNPESKNFLDEFNQKPEDPFEHFNQTAEPVVEPVTEPASELGIEEIKTPGDPETKTRRERRLMEKLQGERESSIALAAKLDAITQSQNSRTEQSQFLDVAERIYGNQTPELREATELLKTALMGAKDEAKREALAEWQSINQKEKDAISSSEKRIDQMIESIEDERNIDLSEGPHRTGFLKLLERMSPKDSAGNIIEYADHYAVWDVYQSQVKKPVNPAKELASKTMTTSASSSNSNLTNDAHEQWLRENGII